MLFHFKNATHLLDKPCNKRADENWNRREADGNNQSFLGHIMRKHGLENIMVMVQKEGKLG